MWRLYGVPWDRTDDLWFDEWADMVRFIDAEQAQARRQQEGGL